METLIFGIITAIVGLCSLIISFLALARNKKSDDRTEGKESGVLFTELGYIKKGIEGIEQRLEKQETQYISVIEKLTSVESSVKQAHKRIDALEEYHKPK